MAKKLYPESAVQDIADAIRAKNGSSETYTIGEMAQAIDDIIPVFEAGTIGTTFDGYKDIGKVNVPDGVTSIGNYAFANCSKLVSIDLPNSLTSIGESAFQLCTSLASIDLPDNLTSISEQAFQQCESLASIDLPNSITSIGHAAFYNCTSLALIDLPNSLTSIGRQGFRYCASLTTIISRNTTPPTIESNTFGDIPADAAIYVPAESVEAYKAAQYWSDRASYIQAIPSEG